MLGGEVLNAKRLKDATRIETLQLPLDEDGIPVTDRTASEGRFLAVKKEFLDPATLPHGTRVTIVGEVTGAATLPLDETEYTYPVLEIKDLKVWQKMDVLARQYRPYPYRPYPYGPLYWRPWGYSPYWWW
jgi:outer membrane lipoprotein